MTQPRPRWGQFFLGIAEAASARSSCPRLAVGAVLVNPTTRAVLAMGYNGALRGRKSCQEVGCHLESHKKEDGSFTEHCVRAVHAEQNALLHAASHGVMVNGCDAYVTAQPCWQCARALYQAGCRKVVYATSYGGEVHPLLQDLVDHGDFKFYPYARESPGSGSLQQVSISGTVDSGH